MKTGIKKLFAGIIALTLAMGALAGCTQTKPEPSNSPELNGETGQPDKQGQSNKATLVLKNGIVYTMTDSMQSASAVAVRDDTIIYVGDDEGVEEYVGDSTQIIDLEGKTVTPGFVDGHIHAGYEAATRMFQIYFTDLEPDKEVYLEAIKNFVDSNPDINLVSGFGWQVDVFGDEGPSKEMLDSISSDVPMILRDISGHIKWCNSLALEMGNIDENTDPGAGEIRKDEKGNLTGILVDYTNDSIAEMESSLELTEEQAKQALIEFQELCNQYGITAVSTDSTSMMPDGDVMWKIISEMADDGLLTIRYNEKYRCGHEDPEKIIALINEGKEKYSSDFLNISQVKMLIDGVVEGGTAYLLEPYALEAGYDPDYRGEPSWEAEEFNNAVAAYDAAGIQVHVHAIADASTKMVVDAVERAREINGTENTRHTIAHMTVFDPDDVQRIVDNDIICAIQPIWAYRDPIFSQLEEKMLGPERFASMYLLKDLVDAGAIMTGSADNPATADFAPLSGIEAGATQCSPYKGQDTDPAYLRNAEQTVPVYEMLKAYTYNGAYSMCMENLFGTIEAGKKADLVVLGSDILNIPLNDIAETMIVYTIMNGRIVYEG